jgi:hypothetical protein
MPAESKLYGAMFSAVGDLWLTAAATAAAGGNTVDGVE